VKPKVPCQELGPGNDHTNHRWSGRCVVLGQRTPQYLRRRDYALRRRLYDAVFADNCTVRIRRNEGYRSRLLVFQDDVAAEIC